MTTLEILHAAPDLFLKQNSVSAACYYLYRERKAVRTTDRTATGYRYWMPDHAPKKYLIDPVFKTPQDNSVPVTMNVFPIHAPPVKAEPRKATHAASKIIIRPFIELELGGKSITLNEEEAKDILNTLLTLFPNHGRI